MVRLLIIADDFTGALDTGVKFAEEGAVTKVVAGTGWDFSHMGDEAPEVLVVNAETRHLTAGEAYQVVYRIIKKAKDAGVECIFKKTDSGLRGNIGSELAAALEASGEPVLHFIPAFPKMKRITKDGIHYIDGVPVHKSVFGKDPFEPVINSDVAEIIGEQSDVPVIRADAYHIPQSAEAPSVILYDVEREEELVMIGKNLAEQNRLRVFAGCAGLAAVLPSILNMRGKESPAPRLSENILIICGSINPVTKKQLDYAQSRGFSRIRMTPEQKLKEGYLKSPEGEAAIQSWIRKLRDTGRCIIDTNDPNEDGETVKYAETENMGTEVMREKIAWNLGYVLKRFMECGAECTTMVTGGDTLMGFMKQIRVDEITPICEMAPGIVLSSYKKGGGSYKIITKSGGFGGETLLTDLAEQIVRKR
ncbi:four-carbon acid sugar kinase family protein [Clostridium sp. MCC353]|uniref:four-carbon acid sugar kinase family protein n=1 Tax=Clostridium sp. MCC353 TaxID=2592646 RepID=UPI001C038B4D|nr:four-carbon acid sugar kinase family protein [Clostridium sp. MCC353]MBT9780098.1 four-carbon acid sugar kinase family protein [Clostridium sp. MCC353]